jgi:hypothetical protein
VVPSNSSASAAMLSDRMCSSICVLCSAR